MQLHGSLSGIVVLRDLYGAQTEGRTPSAARAPVRHTDCGLLISLRTLQHEFHAAAPWMMVAPVLGLRGNGGDPLRSTNRGRTHAISGSRQKDYPRRPILSRVRCIASFGFVLPCCQRCFLSCSRRCRTSSALRVAKLGGLGSRPRNRAISFAVAGSIAASGN